MQREFIDAYYNGDLEMVKQLYNDDDVDKEDVFIQLCCFGYYDLVKWFIESGINLHVNNDEAIVFICGKASLEFSKWFISLSNFNMNAEYIGWFDQKYNAFTFACAKGNFENAQWLYSIHSEYYNDLYLALVYSARINHFELVKWIYSLKLPNDKIERIDEILDYVYWHELGPKIANINIVKFIISIGADIYTQDHCILKYSDDNELIKFIYSLYDKSKTYDFDEYKEISKLVKNEKETYIKEILIPLKFENIMNNPMFDMNLFIAEIPKYLFY